MCSSRWLAGIWSICWRLQGAREIHRLSLSFAVFSQPFHIGSRIGHWTKTTSSHNNSRRISQGSRWVNGKANSWILMPWIKLLALAFYRVWSQTTFLWERTKWGEYKSGIYYWSEYMNLVYTIWNEMKMVYSLWNKHGKNGIFYVKWWWKWYLNGGWQLCICIGCRDSFVCP